ncbi:hypothetical protein F5884DRAFT_34685 [Xylogone sp. PMI_703]|nr:hypothetical protein F5884DRAFT_34685 [Xylogone sp. PMI_703]
MYLSTGNKLGEDPEKHSIPLVEANRSPQRKTMFRVSRFILGFLVLSLFTFTLISASTDPRNPRNPRNPNPVPSDQQRDFQSLLDSVSPSSLHDILHKHLKDKFKHGVYSEDKAALEAVHKTNAAAATSLVELAKRQSGPTGNGTVSSPPTSSSVPPPPPSSTPTSTPSSEAPPPSSTTTTTPPPTSSQAPPSTTPSTTPPTTSTSSSVSSSATSTPTSTPTPSSAPPPASTPDNTPTQRFTTSKVIVTSTLPGGEVSTVTELTIVAATGDSTASAPSKASISASLQSDKNVASSLKSQGPGIIILGIAGMALLGLI